MLAASLEIQGHRSPNHPSLLTVHAVCVCNDSSYFYAEIQSHLNALGLQLLAQDIIDIIDGYQGVHSVQNLTFSP